MRGKPLPLKHLSRTPGSLSATHLGLKSMKLLPRVMESEVYQKKERKGLLEINICKQFSLHFSIKAKGS